MRENVINMQLPNWLVLIHFHFTNRRHPVCLAFRSRLDPLLVGCFTLSSQSGEPILRGPLLGFSPFSPGKLLLLTLLGVQYQCPPPKAFPGLLQAECPSVLPVSFPSHRYSIPDSCYRGAHTCSVSPALGKDSIITG